MSFDPNTLKYTASHEWVHVDGSTATIGISDFAVHELTDLVYIELPKPGRAFKKGEVFGVVESVKAASDLYAPVSGEVIAANGELEGDLGKLSTDPYGAGWMIRMKLSEPGELASLMSAAEYDVMH
jgi:glycine cleavage system H protein